MDMSKALIGLPCTGLRMSERAGWWDPLTCSAGLSPGSFRLKKAVGTDVWPRYRPGACLRPMSCAALANRGWYRGRNAFRPNGWDDWLFLFTYIDLVRRRNNKMKDQLERIKLDALAALDAADSPAALEELRVKLLGKKGELTAVLKQMGKLSPEERPVMGQLANSVRASIEQKLEERKAAIHAAVMEAKLASEAIDVTIPGETVTVGHQHPMNQVLQQIKDIFVGLGYQVVDGPEVELASYNFTRLNIEEGHPSRDRSDTFYFTDDDSVLLRTQTSPMQIRAMEVMEPPICVLAPGRVFRKDEADATHSPMFHQIEGLVVDKNITMGDLKGALITMMRKIYGEDAQMRFRPHHFPFTEPSCEMDMQCHKCHGTGEVNGQVCSTCHGEGWIELLGAGMVHPEVLRGCGIDPDVYSGFAFGMGLERMAMGRMRINDLRLIFDNDVRFLNQF